ncbi:MAG: type II toxin-antitoxin system HicA family toxin [Thermodesulfobacteriota bacterium]
MRALAHDGFEYRRRKGSQRVYLHPDGRREVSHYHHAKDTLPSGTLKSFLEATRWNEDDLESCIGLYLQQEIMAEGAISA